MLLPPVQNPDLHARPCFCRCRTPVEKNGGCNHMVGDQPRRNVALLQMCAGRACMHTQLLITQGSLGRLLLLLHFKAHMYGVHGPCKHAHLVWLHLGVLACAPMWCALGCGYACFSWPSTLIVRAIDFGGCLMCPSRMYLFLLCLRLSMPAPKR